MSNLYDKAKDSRGIMERIASYIPGFGGYLDKETRREADKMEREFVATKIFDQKNSVKRLVDALMGEGIYDGLAYYDKLMSKMDKVAQKIRSAPQGWSGMFASQKVDETTLERLYAYDLGLVEAAKECEQVGSELKSVGGDAAKAKEKAKKLDELMDKIDDYFNKRSEWIAKV